MLGQITELEGENRMDAMPVYMDVAETIRRRIASGMYPIYSARQAGVGAESARGAANSGKPENDPESSGRKPLCDAKLTNRRKR